MQTGEKILLAVLVLVVAGVAVAVLLRWNPGKPKTSPGTSSPGSPPASLTSPIPPQCASGPSVNWASLTNVPISHFEVFTPSQVPQLAVFIGGANRTQSPTWPSAGCFAALLMPGDYDFGALGSPYSLVVTSNFSLRGLGTKARDTRLLNCVLSVAPSEANYTDVFWRDCENLVVTFPEETRWFTSQMCPLRRVGLEGDVLLDECHTGGGGGCVSGWASGGFFAQVSARTVKRQTGQQFCYRSVGAQEIDTHTIFSVLVNTMVGDGVGAFCNSGNARVTASGISAYDKPWLLSNGCVALCTAPTLADGPDINRLPDAYVTRVYVAKTSDTAATLQSKVVAGGALVFPPGEFHLDSAVTVTVDDFVILGIGWPILHCGNQTEGAFQLKGARNWISGLLVDAGPGEATSLVLVAGADCRVHDLCCRIFPGTAQQHNRCDTMLTVSGDRAYLENVWLWRADHGSDASAEAQVGQNWDWMDCPNGLTVTGNDVVAVGLAVEHQSGTITKWSGENGAVYFYQSEFQYSGPAGDWSPSYEVDPSVTKHTLMGAGAYFVLGTGNAAAVPVAFKFPGTASINSVIARNWQGIAPSVGVEHTLQCGDAAPTPANVFVCSGCSS